MEEEQKEEVRRLLRRPAMKPRRLQWNQRGGPEKASVLFRFTCGGCKRRYRHRCSLNRHKKKCMLDLTLWRCLKRRTPL